MGQTIRWFEDLTARGLAGASVAPIPGRHDPCAVRAGHPIGPGPG